MYTDTYEKMKYYIEREEKARGMSSQSQCVIKYAWS